MEDSSIIKDPGERNSPILLTEYLWMWIFGSTPSKNQKTVECTIISVYKRRSLTA